MTGIINKTEILKIIVKLYYNFGTSCFRLKFSPIYFLFIMQDVSDVAPMSPIFFPWSLPPWQGLSRQKFKSLINRTTLIQSSYWFKLTLRKFLPLGLAPIVRKQESRKGKIFRCYCHLTLQL